MQGEIEVTLVVRYGDRVLQTKKKDISGNPLYAPRVVRRHAGEALEEVSKMLSSITGDIDRVYGD